MEFYAEAPSLSELPLRCQFCLRSAERVHLSRRDLTAFYTTFWPCGLGQQMSGIELRCVVCAYCWIRAAQCVRFIECASAAERVLSGTDVQTNTQESKLYNLSIMKLEPTDYYCRQDTEATSDIKYSKTVNNMEFPKVFETEFQSSDSNCTPHVQPITTPPKNLVKIEKSEVEHNNIIVRIDTANSIDEDCKEVKEEPGLSDSDASVSSGPREERDHPKVPLRKAAREEMREIEAQKLRDLRMEPLRFSVPDMLEEIRMKKQSEKYLSKKYKCDMCGSAYSDEEAYENHVKKFHDESAGNMECEVCRYRFADGPALKRHLLQHERRWRCLDCGAVLVKRGQCAVHRVRCGAAGQPHSCSICGNTFRSEIHMKVHVRKSHTRRKEKKFACDICGRAFVYKYKIRDHIRSHLNIKPFECETCGKKFTNQSLYNAHKKAHGPPAALEDRYCVECDRYFTNPRLLDSHLTSSLRHVTKESFQHACGECPQRFKVASHLQLHVNTVHLDNRAHRCQQCDKAYYTKAALKIHVRNKHTQRERQRDHVCPVCQKSFLASSSLKNHMVGVHSNERPYACDICGATFGFKAALYTHNKLKHKMKTEGRRRQTQ